MAELVLQEYLKEVFGILKKQVTKDVSDFHIRQIVWEMFKERVSKICSQGWSGICLDDIALIIKCCPHLVKACNPCHLKSGAVYNENLTWYDHICTLIDWDDHNGKAQGWENSGFH